MIEMHQSMWRIDSISNTRLVKGHGGAKKERKKLEIKKKKFPKINIDVCLQSN